MFERFTEKARRVIFFARYEASQFGSHAIHTEHLLLGLLREDKALARRFFADSRSFEGTARQLVEQRSTYLKEKLSTSVDLPLSNESKRVLSYAAEEADGLKHMFIGTQHLLLGLLREKNGMAAEILAPLSMDLQALRMAMKETVLQASDRPVSEESRYRAESATFFGKYRGTVVSNMDPLQLGRVQAIVPAVTKSELNWATPCTPFPAALIPTLTVPPVGATVWIEFEGGDLDYPIWSGCFWEQGQTPLLKLP